MPLHYGPTPLSFATYSDLLAAVAANGGQPLDGTLQARVGDALYTWDPSANGGAYAICASIAKSKNLVNKATATDGYFMSANGSTTASGTYSYSQKIPVEVGKTYHLSSSAAADSARFVACYNSSGIVVAAAGSNAAVSNFTVPSGVASIVVTMPTTEKDTWQVEAGTSRTSYQSYGATINGIELSSLSISATANSWSGKKASILSDSIGNTGWPAIIAAKIGVTIDLNAVGGTKISGESGSTDAMCQDARIATIDADASAVFLVGGTNDWAQDVALGTGVDETDPTKFYGALNTFCTKFFAAHPAKRLFLQTTTYGELYNYVPRGWSNAYTNNQGLTTKAYAQAIRDVAKKWGIPVVDIDADSGWNTVNITTFITDDGGLVHPNSAGASRMAMIYVGRLLALQPE